MNTPWHAMLVCVMFCVGAGTTSFARAALHADLSACAAIGYDAQRLHCYDRLAARVAATPAPAEEAQARGQVAAVESAPASPLAERWELDAAARKGIFSFTPYQQNYLDLTLAFERQRTRAYVGSSYYQNIFIGSGELDEDGWGATAGISRQFTQLLQGFLDLGYSSRNFESDIGSDDTRTFSARLDWQAGRSIFVTAGYRYEQRDSDIYEAGTYTENFAYLSFSYRYVEAAAPRGVIVISCAPTNLFSAGICVRVNGPARKFIAQRVWKICGS